MATKCMWHHLSWSFYGLALSHRAFSPAFELVERHKTLDECELVSRFPLLFLWSSSALIALPFPLCNLAFFCRFPRRAGCNPATPIVVHEGGGGGYQARREQSERQTSCYICNVFAFTIFQLVCILEPLLLASTLVPSIFFLPLSPRLPLRYARNASSGCCTLRLPASWTIAFAAQ